ncbi:hypothetical protein MNBD_ALPHA08-277 [hydrothermal vent metagenome]|uniref:Uncharacterized protein n=1 Tax=hydrothermal vent metagenome TaxID=652676 RepID=A0A3B0SHE8_9ZZZZ
MTQKKDHITQLLDQAPETPPSPQLRTQIVTAALLDAAPLAPPSPDLHQNILAAAKNEPPATAKIIAFAPSPARRWINANALAGGLLAASLILGIWTGSSGVADSLLAAPFELAGLPVAEAGDDFSLYSVLDGLTPSENLQ